MVNNMHGFELTDERAIPELEAKAVRYRHEKTGADFLSLQNDDENKVFGITFRTVPSDSTGIAHILEHSVLCGSEKYPVKEPFVELLKGSLKSFLNAFTFPDKTCYPVASPHTGDLYNLMDVYLDAVFHPRLSPRVLQQEGWHFHQESREGPMTIKGVVYNEMKGVYSSPDALLGEALQQALFPDTPYGLDSGGDPRCIPDLTWEAFEGFYRRNYHPSNACIFMAGDDDPTERLRRLNDVLSSFDAIETDGAISVQSPFPEARRLRHPFCADPSEAGGDRGLAAMCWALPDPLDPLRTLTFETLAHLLLGTSAAPLRKALIDSDLGEGLAGAGMETQLRQMYLAAGLRGIRPADTEKMEGVIRETLDRIVARGLEKEEVKAALNTVEFVLREQNTGAFPRGLALMLRALSGWLYGADPIEHLAFEQPLQTLKRQAAEPGFFESLIRTHLLQNPHRATLTLEPDPDLSARLAAEEQARIDRFRAALRPGDLDRVMADTRALQAAQEKPDAPEDLARIPSLTVGDLDRKNRRIPGTFHEGTPGVLVHPMPTRGIVYFNLALPLQGLPDPLLPWVPIFARALFETGTAKDDFVALSRRIGRETGGLGAGALTLSRLDDGRASAWFRIHGKALESRTGAMLDILSDAVGSARLDDRARIRQMVLEAKAGTEAALLHAGHSFIARRLAARLEESAWIEERMSGIEALFSLRRLARRVDTEWDRVRHDLYTVRDALLNARGSIASLTAEADTIESFRARTADWVGTLPQSAVRPSDWRLQRGDGHEALTLPAHVNYVGLGCTLYPTGYAFHGAALIAARLLSTGWLWDRVRVRGGAYGAFCRFSRATGVCTFASYRDPNVDATIEIFRGSPAWLREAAGDSELRHLAVIGTIGEMDAPQLPDAKGRTALTRHLAGDDEDRRDRLREEVLHTGAEDLRRFADALEAALPSALCAVLGSPESVEGLARAVDGPTRSIPVLSDADLSPGEG